MIFKVVSDDPWEELNLFEKPSQKLYHWPHDPDQRAMNKHPIIFGLLWSVVAIPWGVLTIAERALEPPLEFFGNLFDPRLTWKQRLPEFLRKD